MQYCKDKQAQVPLPSIPSVNLKEVTVLSKDDWNRIQMHLERKDREKREREKILKDREDLINKSKSLVKNWTNTVEGKRRQKKLDRQLQDQKEEEEKQLVDLEEAKYQKEKRKEVIENAKKQLYFETDRLKTFHTALRLTEVLKDREAQIELKRLRDEERKKSENSWVEIDQDQLDDILSSEQKKKENIQKRNREHIDFIKAQMKAAHLERENEKMASLKEGEELKYLHEKHKEEQELLEKLKFEEMKQLRLDYDLQLADKKRLKEVEEKMQKEEDEECRIFAAAKRKMIKLRWEKENEIQGERTRKLDEIKAKLSAQMKVKMDDEEERISAVEQEKEAAMLKQLKEREEKNLKIREEMRQDRITRSENQERDRQQLLSEQIGERKRNEEADRIFKNNEDEKSRRRLQEYKDLSAFHIKQNSEAKLRRKQSKDLDLALDQINRERTQDNERKFQEYATNVIEKSRQNGRNVKPLEKCANTPPDGDTSKFKQNCSHGGSSKKKLGFVW